MAENIRLIDVSDCVPDQVAELFWRCLDADDRYDPRIMRRELATAGIQVDPYCSAVIDDYGYDKAFGLEKETRGEI